MGLKDFDAAEEVADLVGTGDAKVSLSFGMADKEFGSGYDVHVSVTLSCEQDPEVIRFAYVAASEIISEVILEANERAKELWEQER